MDRLNEDYRIYYNESIKSFTSIEDGIPEGTGDILVEGNNHALTIVSVSDDKPLSSWKGSYALDMSVKDIIRWKRV